MTEIWDLFVLGDDERQKEYIYDQLETYHAPTCLGKNFKALS